MKKTIHIPWSISWAKALIWLRLVIYFGLFLLYYYFIFLGGPGEGFLEGIKRAYFQQLEPGGGQNKSYHFGLVSGYLLLPMAALLAQLILIRTRKRYVMLLIISTLEMLLTLSRQQIPIIGLIVMMLILLNSSRNYFYPVPAPDENSSILDDIDF